MVSSARSSAAAASAGRLRRTARSSSPTPSGTGAACPPGYSVGGSSGVDFGRQSEANRIRNTLITKYNYDPGGLDQFTRHVDNNKFFVRGDVNFSSNHRLDGPAQLHRRHQRHRPSEPDRVLLSRLLLSLPQQDQLHGRPAEQRARQRRSTSFASTTRGCATTATATRRSRRWKSSLGGAGGGSSEPDASDRRPPTRSTRTSSR